MGPARRVGVLLAALVALTAAAAQAQPPTPNVEVDIGNITVNYVYAAQLGFGGYSIGGLTVGVYTAPLAYTFADALGPGYDVRVRLPPQYGNYQFQATRRGRRRSPSTPTRSPPFPGSNSAFPSPGDGPCGPMPSGGC